MTAYEFVSSMFQDLSWSERPEPMTNDDAAYHLRCCVDVDHLQIPDGLTPQLYSDLWNSFCLTDTMSNSYNLPDETKGETTMTKAFVNRILREHVVDTAKYRYIIEDCDDGIGRQWAEIKRLPLSKLDTIDAIDGWEFVKAIE